MSTDTTLRRFSTGKALVLGAVGLLVALSGQAAERVMLGTQAARVTVAFGDLNLSSPAGAKTLYARLGAAARTVCGVEPRLAELRAHASFRSCYDQALESAVRKVDNARLYAVHKARTSPTRAG